jgi:metallo-beta-lactamase class B
VRWSISTHSHADRTGSINILRRHGVATYASSATKALCIAKGECVPAFTFAQDTTFHLGSLTVEAFYPGPGHTPDNIVVWLAGSRILYGGCFVKSTQARNLGNLADADVDQWPASLASVTKRFPDPAFIVPGHESWHSKKSILHTLKLLRRHSTKAKMKAP